MISRSMMIVCICTGISCSSSDPIGDAGVHAGSCDPACAATEVCSAGECIEPGPSACGGGTYAEGLPSSGVLYVDASGAAGGDGSAAKPFATITDALAAGGETIAIAGGVYDEALVIDRDVALRCRCPDKVRLAQPVAIAPKASDITVSITGCAIAPVALGASLSWGACGDGAGGDGIQVTSATERSADVFVGDSVIAGWCAGVRFNAATGSSSALCVSRSRLHRNRKGLELLNAPLARLAGSGDCAALPEAVAVVESLLDENADAAVFARQKARGIGLASNRIVDGGTLGGSASDGAGFGVYLGDTSSVHLLDNQISNNLGVGLGLVNAELPGGATVFAIENNLVTNNHGAGIALQQLQASQAVRLVGNLVGGTVAGLDRGGGDGIVITVEQGQSYEVLLEGNVVIDSTRHGALLSGVGGLVNDNLIRDSGGYGLLLQQASVKAVKVGSNVIGGNGSGDVHNAGDSDPLEKYGVLPLPLP